jgi:3'(2'), 5'-bisphosphate nucleotidase
MTSQKLLLDQVLLSSLKKLVLAAGHAILEIYHSGDFDIAHKSNDSPVTKADIAAHHILVKGLSSLTPTIPVVSEEDDSSVSIPKSHSLYWLIDPLDGTKEFIQKSDEFTVNLALIENNKTIFGIVGIPALNTLYWGGKDRGSYKSIDDFSDEIHVASLNGSTRVFASKSHLNAETETFIQALKGPVQLIQAGSSLKFLRIAEGQADIYPRLAPTCEWDTAAAHAVLEGAGGTVTQTDGTQILYGKPDILNPHFIARGKM